MLTRRLFNLLLGSTAVSGWLARNAESGTAYRPMFDFCIAGGHYHALPEVLDELRPGVLLELVREPDNPYDANAIAVHWRGRRVGYVPREANAGVARMMDEGLPARAVVIGTLTVDDEWELPDDLRFTDVAAGDPVLRLEVAVRRV